MHGKKMKMWIFIAADDVVVVLMEPGSDA